MGLKDAVDRIARLADKLEPLGKPGPKAGADNTRLCRQCECPECIEERTLQKDIRGWTSERKITRMNQLLEKAFATPALGTKPERLTQSERADLEAAQTDDLDDPTEARRSR